MAREPRVVSEDFHVSVDFESLIRDTVWFHGSRVFEPPHLDDLDHELNLAVLSLVEAHADHAVRDVLHEAVPRGPRGPLAVLAVLSYSTRPSREDRGFSSFTSAVKTQVAPVDLSCLHNANSFSRRSVSSAKSMFSKLIESIATREAPLRLMKSGSSERIRVTVVFASTGSSFTMWSFFSLRYRLRSQPNDAAFATTESTSSSREMETAF